MQAAAGHAAHPHTSRLGDRCETETEGSVEHNTLHVGAGNCNLRTLQQRDGGQVFGFKGLNLLEQILTALSSVSPACSIIKSLISELE